MGYQLNYALFVAHGYKVLCNISQISWIRSNNSNHIYHTSDNEDLQSMSTTDVENMSDSAFNFKLPDFPSDSSRDEDRRARKKRRRTVRFADDIAEEPSEEPQSQEVGLKKNSYTPRTLRACCSQSKFRILKIRESSARALFLYNCTPNISRRADTNVSVA